MSRAPDPTHNGDNLRAGIAAIGLHRRCARPSALRLLCVLCACVCLAAFAGCQGPLAATHTHTTVTHGSHGVQVDTWTRLYYGTVPTACPMD